MLGSNLPGRLPTVLRLARPVGPLGRPMPTNPNATPGTYFVRDRETTPNLVVRTA